MASSLSFEINLAGNFSAALEKANTGLRGTGEGAKKASKELSLFEGEIEGVKGGLGGLELNFSALAKGGSLFTFDLAEGLHAAFEVLERVIDGFIDLGKEMVGVAAKTEDLNLAIELNVGPAKAKEIEELADSFERTTRFDASDIKKAVLPLLKQGISDTSLLDDIATIGTDIAARTGGGIGEVQHTIDSFASIFQKGRLKPAGLEAFGIQANDYFGALGKSLGVSTEAAAKLAKAGKVSQDKLARLAINMVAARQGGAIGDPSLRSAETLGGTLQRLSNVKDNLFEGLANSPGMQAVQGFLDNFIATMKGPIGTDLINEIGNAFKDLFGDLSGPGGLDKVKSGVLAVAGNVRAFLGEFKAALPEIKAAASSVLEVIRILPSVLSEVVALGTEFAIIWTGDKILFGITRILTALASGGLGGALVNLRAGLNSALSPIAAITIAFEAWRYAFERISATLKELGGASAVLADFKDWIGGAHHAEAKGNSGFAAMQAQNAANLQLAHGGSVSMADSTASIPMMASGGIVTGPTLALIGEAGPEAVIPLGSSGSPNLGGDRTTHFSPVINITTTGEESDVHRVAVELQQAVRVEFKKLMDEADATLRGGAAVMSLPPLDPPRLAPNAGQPLNPYGSSLPSYGEWFTASLGGQVLPGKWRCTSGGLRVKVDQKKKAGADGGNPVFHGIQPITFELGRGAVLRPGAHRPSDRAGEHPPPAGLVPERAPCPSSARIGAHLRVRHQRKGDRLLGPRARGRRRDAHEADAAALAADEGGRRIRDRAAYTGHAQRARRGSKEAEPAEPAANHAAGHRGPADQLHARIGLLSLCTCGSADIIEGRIHMPLRGLWWADLKLDTQTAMSGQVAIASAGGMTITGTVVKSGAFLNSAHVRVFGGAAGSATVLKPAAYQNALVRDPLNYILSATGDSLSSTVSPALLAALLPFWSVLGENVGPRHRQALRCGRQGLRSVAQLARARRRFDLDGAGDVAFAEPAVDLRCPVGGSSRPARRSWLRDAHAAARRKRARPRLQRLGRRSLDRRRQGLHMGMGVTR